MATPIVAVRMNRISCAVERKLAGRASGLGGALSGAVVTSSGYCCFSVSSEPAIATDSSIEAVIFDL